LKIVYHCYGGAHASTTAAAIHLGIIPKDRLPHFSDFQRIPYFDRTTSIQHGKLIKVGDDADGNEVFVLGRRNSPRLVIHLITEFLRLNGEDPKDYLFVSCVQLFNPFMVTGGFSSRAMGWVKIGRPMVTFGTIISFPFLVTIVRRTLQSIARDRSK
jgi:hypothetical protein